jgi:hypothetical protein
MLKALLPALLAAMPRSDATRAQEQNRLLTKYMFFSPWNKTLRKQRARTPTQKARRPHKNTAAPIREQMGWKT